LTLAPSVSQRSPRRPPFHPSIVPDRASATVEKSARVARLSLNTEI
jgi:hypothetical protein